MGFVPGQQMLGPAGTLMGQSGAASIIKYDPADFIVGGRGKKNGEMVPVSFKIHEGYRAEGRKWMEAGVFPYKDHSDLVRHAYVRHVRQYLPAMEGEVRGSLLHVLGQIDQETADWRIQNDFVASIEAIADQVGRTLHLPGGKREVTRKLRAFKKQLDKAKPGFYKNVYMKMFDDRFGAYIGQIDLVTYTDNDGGYGEECGGGMGLAEWPVVPDFGGDE